MVNKELSALCGTPMNASEGKITRSDNEAARRGAGVDLGMAPFNPRKGANPRGVWIVDGTAVSGGSGGSRSTRRSAGAAPDSSA